MSVNTELQNLLTKMGGTPLESDSNSDFIKKISNAYDGSGSGGGSGDVAIVQMVADENTMTITTKAGELYSMCESGPVFVRSTVGGISYGLINEAAIHEDGYSFVGNENLFVAETANDYPVRDGGSGPK